MSWFDASGLANIAKSAFKEAQRTIDKALDIKEDANVVPANTPIDPNIEDFFGTWGITESGNIHTTRKDSPDVLLKSPSSNKNVTGSIWGSFTGSFFDNTKENVKSNSVDSLDDLVDVNSEHFNRSKLVVQNSEEGDTQITRTSFSEGDLEKIADKQEYTKNIDRDKSGEAHSEQLSSLKHQNDIMKVQLDQQQTEKQIAEQELRSIIDELKDKLKSKLDKIDELTQEISILQQQLYVEKSEIERKRSGNLQERDKIELHSSMDHRTSPHTGTSSPTLSLGKASVSESMGSSFWSQDEPFEISQTPRYTNMFEMQMLQTNLKQKDGELQQLQWEMNRREQERSLLNKIIDNGSNSNSIAGSVKRREKPVSSYTNRLSAVSCESGKNSSESVELITGGTECTNTPESDLLSFGQSVSTSSSLGLKQASDSVEVLADSLTSPSSVEIICSSSSNSRRQSQHTDEFVSPLESPFQEEKPSICPEKTSPDSVEVIPEDQEENSVAEDTMSYTSISESTSATVLDSAFNLHLKPQKMLKDTFNRQENMNESITSDISLSPEKSLNFADAITRAPSRSSMHLPLTQVNQVLIDTQPQSSMQDISSILRNTNVIDIPQDNETLKNSGSDNLDTSNDEGSQSDKTLINDNNMESSSDTSTIESNTNSVYLKNMLADAMTEKNSDTNLNQKSNHFMDLTQSMIDSTQSNTTLQDISLTQLDMPPRENSPMSSESRSDLVKIGSDHTSGHTSGDELETTTSSDIEIISSPNGDSSSTQSRQSPAKQTCSKPKTEDSQVDTLLCKMTMKKAKGHTRELSGASSISDDSHSSEVDRLIKRISEISEILELRETKLIEVNRRNAELQELNNNLKQQLDLVLSKQLETADLSQVTEEYTQRLSALEKKFQQAIRDKDTLRKQLEQCKQDASMKLSKGELESMISEKDEVIEELRGEGEKLSKQQLQHSNIIKKLRVKEKENESTIKKLKENIEDLSSETERLKRSLAAKEEVERTQIEAVHQLTGKNKKQELEVNKLQSNLDDLTQKYDTVKKSLDAAKKELVDKSTARTQLHAREQLLECLENEKKLTESQNEEIINQLEDLRLKLRQSEQEHIKRELVLRNENSDLLKRIESAEMRNEELSQSVLEVSKPLVRQLESLQATYNAKLLNFEKIEADLTSKINELQSRLQLSLNVERSSKEECINLRAKVVEIEGQLSSLKHQNDIMKVQLDQQQTEKQIAEQELRSIIDELKDKLKSKLDKIDELTQEISILQQQIYVEKSEIERKRSGNLQERDKIELHSSMDHRTSPHTGTSSPTLSLGKASVSESMGSSFWSQDEPFEISQTPRYTNMFEMQMLQTNLKQKDGELQQLQWEMNRREQERSLLNSEISNLLIRVEELETKVTDYDSMKTEFDKIKQEYDTLCLIYGEKVEENEELKLDLDDVKEMYKGQIDELLRQQRQTTS